MSGDPERHFASYHAPFFRAFSRPIYAHLWICWLCVAFMLIGASDFRHASDSVGRIGRPLWIGGAGLLFETVLLLFNACQSEGRKALLAPTADRIKGRTPIMLWAVALLEAVAVIVVWL